MASGLIINDIEMDYFGSGLDFLATSGVNACISLLVITDHSQHSFVEHRSPTRVPSVIDLDTVRAWLQDVAEHVSFALPTSTITRAVPEPTQISTDPVAGMIDLGSSIATGLLAKAKVLKRQQTSFKSFDQKINQNIEPSNDESDDYDDNEGLLFSYGQEGRQAVLASDYSFGQFRYLERLLLVHGRWSYLRISKFLRYFFYKNFAFTLCHFWFGFFSGFSAQTLYDPFFVATYNVFFSSLPVLALGVFDQDVSADHSMSKPPLYTPGQNNEFFNKKIFAESVIHGILTSCIIFFVPYLSVSNSTRPGGMTQADLQSFGFMVATIMVIVVNLENALETWYWTGLYHFVLWGTIVVHFLFHFVLYSTIIYQIFNTNYGYVGVAQAVLSTGNFWFTLFLTCTILLLPVFCREFFRMRFMPTKTDRARLNQKFRTEEKAAFVAHIQQKLRQSKRSIRSGYAFSQQQGWGPLITSGRMQSKSATRNRQQQQPQSQNQNNNNVIQTRF
ncbi:unnamed protein product [Adineta ricciae]|uniref:P-type ATPase C-terminal domain-containing protein n=1 Tax=Adineta ricciae TaxID=249248 RepID=A0A813ZT18_ADIRI|nr:unnamed protein product [Adineta ricciae]